MFSLYKLPIMALAFFALAPGISADMHTQLFCVDGEARNPNNPYKITLTRNPTATTTACNNYKTQGCGDCVAEVVGDKTNCNSPTKLLDGDTFDTLCKDAGAFRGYKNP